MFPSNGTTSQIIQTEHPPHKLFNSNNFIRYRFTFTPLLRTLCIPDILHEYPQHTPDFVYPSCIMLPTV